MDMDMALLGYVPETTSVPKPANHYATRPICTNVIRKLEENVVGEKTTFKYQGYPISSVVLVGKTGNVQSTEKVSRFELDDGFGGVSVTYFGSNSVQDGDYVKIIGYLEKQKESVHLLAQGLEIVKDYNMITQHLLEVMNCYTYYEKLSA